MVADFFNAWLPLDGQCCLLFDIRHSLVRLDVLAGKEIDLELGRLDVDAAFEHLQQTAWLSLVRFYLLLPDHCYGAVSDRIVQDLFLLTPLRNLGCETWVVVAVKHDNARGRIHKWPFSIRQCCDRIVSALIIWELSGVRFEGISGRQRVRSLPLIKLDTFHNRPLRWLHRPFRPRV